MVEESVDAMESVNVKILTLVHSVSFVQDQISA